MILGALQRDEREYSRGIFAENYLAIALKMQGYELNYWESDGRAEVDFVIQKDGQVILVECKAGDHVKAKSMMFFRKK